MTTAVRTQAPAQLAPEVETARLRLRAWRLEDFAAWRAHYADPESTRYGQGPLDTAMAWTEFAATTGQWALLGHGVFAVQKRDDGALVGFAGMWAPPWLDEPELCWSLFTAHRGAGYAVEAAAAARDWAGAAHGISPAMSFVHPDNVASRRVAERLGAHIEGETTLRGAPRLVYRHVAVAMPASGAAQGNAA